MAAHNFRAVGERRLGAHCVPAVAAPRAAAPSRRRALFRSRSAVQIPADPSGSQIWDGHHGGPHHGRNRQLPRGSAGVRRICIVALSHWPLRIGHCALCTSRTDRYSAAAGTARSQCPQCPAVPAARGKFRATATEQSRAEQNKAEQNNSSSHRAGQAKATQCSKRIRT